jgi:Eukaryotic protein of unknown function (DUF829)
MHCRKDNLVVILAGWLGCQRRNLRRYESIYSDLGAEVFSYIATPRMVVRASQSSPFVHEYAVKGNSIQELAWDIVRNLRHRPKFVFHAFSNGGCFLWEQVSMILNTERMNQPIGIVFDSAPSNYQNNDNLSKALSYCTLKEQAEVQMEIQLGGSSMKQQRIHRAKLFWEGLRDHEFNTKQLYLCSHDDELTPFQDLKFLVKWRQEVHGKDRIWLRDWHSSPHCGHIILHPEEYIDSLKSFVAHVQTESIPKL